MSRTPFRIIFMGTPDFAVPSLEALIQGPDEIVAVVTQPDRPKGRSSQLVAPPIKTLAETDTFSRVGAKLRCGGVKPEAFPTVERVAGFIIACRQVHLPLKCTAGLHHPVRHRSEEPDVMTMNFINNLSLEKVQ